MEEASFDINASIKLMTYPVNGDSGIKPID
jgi:hypothetical protein